MKQRGLALLELLIVIGVVLAVTGAVVGLAWHVDDQRKVDRAASELGQLVDALDAGNGSTLGHFSGVSSATLAHEAVIPASMIDGATLRSPWGLIQVEPVTLDPRRPHAHVRITYEGLPTPACIGLATAAKGVASGLQVNGEDLLADGLLDRADLVQACQAAPATVVLDHDSGGGGDLSLR